MAAAPASRSLSRFLYARQSQDCLNCVLPRFQVQGPRFEVFLAQGLGFWFIGGSGLIGVSAGLGAPAAEN